MPFNMGFTELLIILVIILLLFGAKRIPEIAGSLGKGINSFKKNLSEVEGTFREGVGTTAPLDSAPRREPLSPGDVQPVSTTTMRPADEVERPEPKRLLS
jgi:sec-independent protein translocase protein TatA